MNRFGRRTILCMLLIVVLAPIWNVLGRCDPVRSSELRGAAHRTVKVIHQATEVATAPMIFGNSGRQHSK